VPLNDLSADYDVNGIYLRGKAGWGEGDAFITVTGDFFGARRRHTKFVLPILRDPLAIGTPVTGLALVEALWPGMCAGPREDGSPIPRTLRRERR